MARPHGLASLPPPSALFLDLDGTLIDSRGDIAAACNHALEAVGRPRLSVAEVSRFVGDGARLLVARALAVAEGVALVDEALVHFHAYYEAHPADHAQVLPGARELLSLGPFKLALATNKPRRTTLRCLEALGLARAFAAIRAGGDGPLKPDPSSLLALLGELGVPASHTWMIGDGEQDVLAGRAAGCVTVGVRGGFQSEERLEASCPDALVGSLVAIVDALTAPRI